MNATRGKKRQGMLVPGWEAQTVREERKYRMPENAHSYFFYFLFLSTIGRKNKPGPEISGMSVGVLCGVSLKALGLFCSDQVLSLILTNPILPSPQNEK